jgi:hypothetical protein
MSFAQPWMLYALPAVLLPLIIHLLNRLRYKTVPWAAMMFLLKANKAATRRAKIRQYLLLASRMALVLFFLWAMARPLVGGWLGSAAGGAPEVVMVLLDRSASMEAGGPERAVSKRAHALSLLAAAGQQSQGSRFVLVESVTREPFEVADLGALSGMSLAGPTDTSADLQAMFLKAAEYLQKNNPGSAEVWVASDFQTSSWRPTPAEWQDVTARFLGLPQVPRVRMLDLSLAAQNNAGLTLKNSELKLGKDESSPGKLSLALEIRSNGSLDKIPVMVSRDGAASQEDLPLEAATQRHVLKYDVASGANASGFGELRLPADENASDNSVWFVYAPPVALKAGVVAENSPAAQRLRISAVPDSTQKARQAFVQAPGAAAGIPWKDTALLVWMAGNPEEKVAKELEQFVQTGGCLVVFPTGAENSFSQLGLSWKGLELSGAEGPFRPASWDELEGPLAKTDSGASLAVARLEVMKRQVPQMADPATRLYASFGDGQPMLVGRKFGSGQLYAFATQPDDAWSNLGDGLVLLPMMQRMLAQGANRLAPPLTATAGEWKPADATEAWTSIATESPRDWRWQAGIYQYGAKRVALNRPASEDDAEAIPAADVEKLLTGLKVEVLQNAMDTKANRLQSEIWQVLLVAAMVLMCLEMLLATSKGMLPAKATLPKATT